MVLLLVTVLALVGLGTAQSTTNCPAGIARDEYLIVYNNLCYQFVVYEQRTYSDASSQCHSHGGFLITVKDQSFTDYLVDKLIYEYGYGTKIWIGLNDKAHEGTFLWEDDSPLDYTNWAPHAGPNSNKTNTWEDCVTLQPSTGGTWEDDVCEDSIFGLSEHRYSFICQYKLRPVTPTPPTQF